MIFDGFDKNNLMNGCPVKTVVRAGGAGDQSNCNSVHGLTVRYYTGTGLGSGTSLDNKEMQTTPAICYIYTWWT